MREAVGMFLWRVFGWFFAPLKGRMKEVWKERDALAGEVALLLDQVEKEQASRRARERELQELVREARREWAAERAGRSSLIVQLAKLQGKEKAAHCGHCRERHGQGPWTVCTCCGGEEACYY